MTTRMVLQVPKDPTPAEWLTRSGIPWDMLATFGPHTLFPAHARLRYAPDDGDAPRPEIPPRPLGEQGDGPVIAELCDMLATDTTTPQLCYFCLWEGWPGINEIITPGPPVVAIPNRTYHLFSGPLSDVGQWCAQPTPDMPPAAFIWPADRAWCVASDVDPTWAFINGSGATISRLVAQTRLDIVAADPPQAR